MTPHPIPNAFSGVESYQRLKLSDQQIGELPMDALHSHPRFRAHRLLSASDHNRLMISELLQIRAMGGQCIAFYEKDAVMAVIGLSPLSWDSAHFGLGMGKLLLIANQKATRLRLALSIGQEIQDLGSKLGISHWSTEVDMDDYSSLNSLLALGFEIMDVKKTYCANRMRNKIDNIRLTNCVRKYKDGDHAAVDELLQHTTFASRFSRDEHLDQNKVQEMYRLWFAQIIDKHTSTSNVLVFEKQNRIVACGAIDELDLNRHGIPVKMMSGGLYASSASGTGGYLPIMHRLTADAIDRHGQVETTVSANNPAACRVLDLFHSHIVTRYALRLYWPQDSNITNTKSQNSSAP